MRARFLAAIASAFGILLIAVLTVPPHHPLTWALVGMVCSVLMVIAYDLWRR
jgi:hypothetical protein